MIIIKREVHQHDLFFFFFLFLHYFNRKMCRQRRITWRNERWKRWRIRKKPRVVAIVRKQKNLDCQHIEQEQTTFATNKARKFQCHSFFCSCHRPSCPCSSSCFAFFSILFLFFLNTLDNQATITSESINVGTIL